MRKGQILKILSEIGYARDKMVDLITVSEIILTSDENLYPEKGTQFYFDTNFDFLKVYYGKIENDIFIPNALPSFIIDFKEIEGFMMTGPNSRKIPYREGMQI